MGATAAQSWTCRECRSCTSPELQNRAGCSSESFQTNALAQIWAIDPAIQIVLCSAHSDHTWEELRTALGGAHRLVVLRKPFHAIEVRQLAAMLTEKWQSERENRANSQHLGRMVDEMRADICQRRRAEA